MGLSGPTVSSDSKVCFSGIQKINKKYINSWKFILPFVGQGMDGPKGEKGDCRMDDNLVSVKHTHTHTDYYFTFLQADS